MSNLLQAQEPSYPAFVRKLFNRSGDPSKDFAHAVLGIATENHELLSATDRVNAIEEIGDAEFYAVALQQVIEDRWQHPLEMAALEDTIQEDVDLILSSTEPYALLQDTTNELLDHAKRWVGYGRAPERLEASYTLAIVAQRVARELSLVKHADATQAHIRSVNMAKLLKRYPGGDFDQFRALQRDLGAERATLESAVLG
jgi:hypothetical protein